MIKIEHFANLALLFVKSNALLVILAICALGWETIGLNLFLSSLFVNKLNFLDISKSASNAISLIASGTAAIFVATMFLILKVRNAERWTIWLMGTLVLAMVLVGNIKSLNWSNIASYVFEDCLMLVGAVIISALSIGMNNILASVINTVYKENGPLNSMQSHFTYNVLTMGEETLKSQGAKIVRLNPNPNARRHRRRAK